MHKVVLYGSGKENIEFKYMNDRGDTSIRRHPFEGVLHNMERRYKETESSAPSLSAIVRAPAAKGRVCVGKRATFMSRIRRYLLSPT